MHNQPVLLDVRYSMSGVCSICGDTLLTSGGSTAEDALARLESVFEQHLAEKHTDAVANLSTAPRQHWQ